MASFGRRWRTSVVAVALAMAGCSTSTAGGGSTEPTRSWGDRPPTTVRSGGVEAATMDLLVIATGEDGFGGLSDGSDGPVCTPSSAGSGRFAGLVVGATVELRGAGDVVRATGALSALTEAVATAEIDALRCRWTATLGPVDEDDAYALVVDGQAIATVRGPARARFDLVL